MKTKVDLTDSLTGKKAIQVNVPDGYEMHPTDSGNFVLRKIPKSEDVKSLSGQVTK